MKKTFLQIVAIVTIFSTTSFSQKLPYKVAYDKFGVVGEYPHLWESTKNLHYSEKQVSFDILEEKSTFRDNVIARENLTIRYMDAVKEAKYAAKITFFSTDTNLVQQILVDEKIVREEVLIPVNEVFHLEINIPKEALQDGTFEITIRKTKGNWATASEVAIFSNEDKVLKEDNYLATIKVPRISPIPEKINDTDELIKNLDGIWQFNPAPEKGFENKVANKKWSDIIVPGEWSMQGFNVNEDSTAAYFRTFNIPSNWEGKRIKLLFNSIYSDVTVFVNGKKAGSHMGGFTAFELDVTDIVKYNSPNKLMLAVKSESLADELSSASAYACHPLGGIQRSVSIFALPQVNISDLAITTNFDRLFKDATLSANIKISNESTKDISGLSLNFELLRWNSNKKVDIDTSNIPSGIIKAGETVSLKFSFSVKTPLKWDCENPNLYLLNCKLTGNDGKLLESTQERFGFRQIDILGNQLFVNGMPVKLRGVNRHEVYPLTGRSIPKEMYRKDLEVFREGNVNHIRTSHYPPDEILMDLADEMGMLIECEAPFCWSHDSKANQQDRREIIIRQNLENVVLNKNHPSIIFWSLANESNWNHHYDIAGQMIKTIDPSRPITFNFFPWDWVGMRFEDEHICEIASDHYPGPNGPKKYENHNRPVYFGEFAHLNAYNRYELATDVALRDLWGIYLHKMWENMYKSKGCMGGSIWAGIDDTFYWDYMNENGEEEERTVGYGTWGPIDGWRRKKPEWWGMKKTYSPIRILNTEQKDSLILINVENRQDFSNLSRLKITWKLGEESGTTTAEVNPKSKGQLIIQPKNDFSNATSLQLNFNDPRGFNVDTFNIVLKEENLSRVSNAIENYKIEKTKGEIKVIGKINAFTINKESGLIENEGFNGPYLMALPLTKKGNTQMHGQTMYYEPYTHTCSEWKLSSIDVNNNKGLPIITVSGIYKEAEGSFIYSFNADGTFLIEYDFKLKEDINPRQLGIIFKLPKDYGQFSWKRKGYWTTYPDWHIARLEGTVNANNGVEATPVGPRSKPSLEWLQDRTNIGSNDFASTKHNIYHASLTNKTGEGLQVLAQTDKHCRVWMDKDIICMLIANYSNGGSERFLRSHAQNDDKPLKVGDKICGKVKMNTFHKASHRL